MTWDIYGFKDNRIYSFFGDDASERCRFYVMNDGMIKCAGSSGAAIQGFSYYELGKNSVSPKRVKNCSREGNDDGSVYYIMKMTKEYRSLNMTDSIVCTNTKNQLGILSMTQAVYTAL